MNAKAQAEADKMAQTAPKELKEAADKEAERIMNSDEGASTALDELTSALSGSAGDTKASRKQTAAYEKLRRIAVSYKRESPDNFVVFGAAGLRFTLGDMRDLFQLPR